ncbi:hypothetical protein P167DRAFT_609393 [Morchella conica CCBAS932]|uniref:Uncharacterized protein n=1 Tax=Morchella conica CCBAS932 TaxID=1392247 RepID=A0A3N4KAL1_9PEZI|nr:hypothetical protein P167DRAFT_609393 [Morchella conica CCBAS932]
MGHSTAQVPVGVQTQLPIFRTFHHNVIWHLWTVLSVATAVVLIYLNFIGHVIGPELGRTKIETKAVLNILLFVAKAHEIAIVLSLANLARQLIQSSLISKKGTILALVGAEQVTATPSVLISNGYRSALKYGLRYFSGPSRNESKTVRSRRRAVLIITGFLLIAAVLCATVGPSSAVLMIPAQHWYLQQTLTQDKIIEDWNQSSIYTFDTGIVRPGHPYIFLSPLDVNGSSTYRSTMYWNDTGTHWQNVGSGTGSESVNPELYVQDLPQVTHIFDVFSHRLSVNSSTTATLDRPLKVDSEWNGGTRFETLMYDDVAYAGQGNITYRPSRKNNASPTHFVTTITAVTSTAVCRRVQRLSCDSQPTTPITDPTTATEWCFQAPTTEDFYGNKLFTNKDLLLLVDYPQNASGQRETDEPETWLPRFHITEGPGLPSHSDFTDSILFVFEFAEDLIVCSNKASLTSATATLAGQVYDVYQAEYHPNLVYEYANKSTFEKTSPNFTFRKGWLDYEHSLGEYGVPSNASTSKANMTRSDRGVTKSEDFRLWAERLVNSTNNRRLPIWQPLATGLTPKELKRKNDQLAGNDMALLTDLIEASTVEVVVGGPWITVLSLLDRSLSQYVLKHDDYSYRDKNSSVPKELFAPDSLIENIEDYRYFVYSSVRVQHFLYGYMVVGITGILAIAVLMTYMVVACCGSIWQLSWGGDVIIAWGSVPEYLLLGESTASELGRLGYADVGGRDKTRYECGVRVDRAADGDYYGIKLGDVEVSEVQVK